MALALLIFLPNLVWLVRHDWISYTFLQHIHVRDVGEGRADGFLKDQFLVCANLFAAPLWIAGLIGFSARPPLPHAGLDVLVPARAFLGRQRPLLLHRRGLSHAPGHGRGQSASAGSISWMPKLVRRTLVGVYFAGLRLGRSVLLAQHSFPSHPAARCATSPSKTAATSAKRSAGTNWSEPSPRFAIRCPPDQQAHLGITTGNYGEYGAIEILGRAYGLPQPIGTTNSEWLRGYPIPPPTTLIVLGLSSEKSQRNLHRLPPGGPQRQSVGVHNEESDYHPDIFVCGPPRLPWPELWKDHKDFG